MAAAGITKRWVRGSLLITVLVILAAEVMFLYTDYRELYGSVQRAAESRFSTIAGRLQATGTAGDANETSESRGQALRTSELPFLTSTARCCSAATKCRIPPCRRCTPCRPTA